MKSCSLAVLAALVVLVLAAPAVLGRPPHRQKRVSDQRLGELEALLALKKLRGKLVTVPVGFGQINPNDYGRKRRSASPHANILLERILEALPQDEVVALNLSQDLYDDLPVSAVALEASSSLGSSDGQGPHFAFERERPASGFNRPVTE